TVEHAHFWAVSATPHGQRCNARRRGLISVLRGPAISSPFLQDERSLARINLDLPDRDRHVALLLQNLPPGAELHAESTFLAPRGAPAVPEPDEFVGSVDLVGDDLVTTSNRCAGRKGYLACFGVRFVEACVPGDSGDHRTNDERFQSGLNAERM